MMLTVAVLGALNSAPPVTPDNLTANVLLPEKGVALLMGIEIVLVEASPFAHFSVPATLVKSVPAAAVPLLVV